MSIEMDEDLKELDTYLKEVTDTEAYRVFDEYLRLAGENTIPVKEYMAYVNTFWSNGVY